MQEGAGGPGTDGEGGGWVISFPPLSLSLSHAHTHTERARERRESLVVGSVCECLVQCTDNTQRTRWVCQLSTMLVQCCLGAQEKTFELYYGCGVVFVVHCSFWTYVVSSHF